MATRNEKKIKMMLRLCKPGTVCLASWLEKQGISRDLQQYYLKSDWLESVGRGAFIRSGDKVGWPGGLYAIQAQADQAIHVGGMSTFSVKGFSHYIRMGRERVWLFATLRQSLPAWFNNHDWGIEVEYVRTSILPDNIGIEETTLDGCTLRFSTLERAMMECLYLTPKRLDMVECYQVMEGLVNLRPKVVQQLLESCTSVKAKRLFLYMAEKAGHQWLQFVDQTNIHLGAGDRSLVDNGVYVAKHHISIPRELAYL